MATRGLLGAPKVGRKLTKNLKLNIKGAAGRGKGGWGGIARGRRDEKGKRAEGRSAKKGDAGAERREGGGSERGGREGKKEPKKAGERGGGGGGGGGGREGGGRGRGARTSARLAGTRGAPVLRPVVAVLARRAPPRLVAAAAAPAPAWRPAAVLPPSPPAVSVRRVRAVPRAAAAAVPVPVAPTRLPEVQAVAPVGTGAARRAEVGRVRLQ